MMPSQEAEMAADDPHSSPGAAGAGRPQAAAGPPGAGGPAAPLAGGPEPGQAEVVRLLVKAVATLPDAERDQVYAWFLDRGIAGTRPSAFTGPGPLPRQLREMSATLLSLQTAGGLAGQQPAGQQVVPVRFAADQHAALRTWCSEHGFSMATVIRGLVARFLDGQLPARN
jgi:hypothetical protein